MSEDEQLPPYAAPGLATVDSVAPFAPRVRWGRAAVLQLVAGGVAGFVVPFCFYVLPQLRLFENFDLSGDAIWLGIFIVSAVVVSVFGGGIPLLVAWLSWLAVSRKRRGLGREVLAVVLGAVGGSLVSSVLPFLFMAAEGSPWTLYAITILILGGIPGIAFALWVVAAWRRARKAVSVAS